MGVEARHWRLRAQRLRLIGECCPHCDLKMFPPRDICTNCLNEAKEPYHFSGRGEIYSFTKVIDAPQGYQEQAPYHLALIRLKEGPLITAQLTDLGNTRPEIGMPVEMVTRKLRSDGDKGIILYGYKFRPLLSPRQQEVSISG